MMNEMPVMDKEMELLEKKRKNEEYLKSAEWKQLLEEARTAVLNSYTVIYRDTDETLREAWHYVSMKELDYLKEKYKKMKKEVIRIVPKELGYGEYLKSIHGSSKEAQ